MLWIMTVLIRTLKLHKVKQKRNQLKKEDSNQLGITILMMKMNKKRKKKIIINLNVNKVKRKEIKSKINVSNKNHHGTTNLTI